MSGQTVAAIPATLPVLVRQAAERLARAETAAEVLEAREMAGLAADEAQRRARLLKARHAHDEVIAAANHAKADALAIESAAVRRLAEEYTQAQARGEVKPHGGPRNFKIPNGNVETSAADLGLSPKHIHEGRQMNKAEQADPGIVARTAHAQAARGEEPTRAKIKRAVKAALQATPNRAAAGGEIVQLPSRKTKGKKLDVPEGVTLADHVRATMRAHPGLSIMALSEALGYGQESTQHLRHLVLLAERTDLSETDGAAVRQAVAEVNRTRQTSKPFERVAALVRRIYGRSRGVPPERSEELRHAAFDRVIAGLSVCEMLDRVDMPHLNARRRRQVLAEMDEHLRKLRDFRARIAGESP